MGEMVPEGSHPSHQPRCPPEPRRCRVVPRAQRSSSCLQRHRAPDSETQPVSMIPGHGPVTQAVLGTLLTWGLTAAGSALVFVFSSGQRRILDGSLGFAAGVMLAASYWSLLAPAIDLAEESGAFGAFAFLPVAAGFTLGAAFVYFADLLIPALGFSGPPHAAFALSCDHRAVKEKYEPDPAHDLAHESELSIRIDKGENGEPYQRRKGVGGSLPDPPPPFPAPMDAAPPASSSSWRRILLMILAITIHNIPEGLAVGVGFGAIGKSASATFQSARNLAIGIGIQNFPEGLAVSLPLRGAGFSTWKAFWYGQLSGMVEPLAGVFGAFAVVVAEPLLPYALGFAAGAMVYVVMDDIIPEAQTSGNGKLASWTSILGFVVMMSLDVGLG
ncbi:zinc transporter ZIP11 isoform X1 [Patagioenas fasciata]|uniref:zinc transporter ZIP11 isoform X1 n=2 Tax=Patagioenas fasciata TaxID=372321 RepID=UPI003A9A61CD